MEARSLSYSRRFAGHKDTPISSSSALEAPSKSAARSGFPSATAGPARLAKHSAIPFLSFASSSQVQTGPKQLLRLVITPSVLGYATQIVEQVKEPNSARQLLGKVQTFLVELSGGDVVILASGEIAEPIQ